jgi:hypothetical protein
LLEMNEHQQQPMTVETLHQDGTMEDKNNDNENNTIITLTADEFLKTGLKLVGYKRHRIRRAKKISNVEHFAGHYGSSPCICASICEDLQTTTVEEARVPVEHLNVAFLSDGNASLEVVSGRS